MDDLTTTVSDPALATSTALDRTRRSLSMRGYLIVMVVAILLPVVLFAAIVFWRYYDSELARIDQELQNNARELSLIIDRDLQGEIVALQTLATSGSMTSHEYARFYEHSLRVRGYAGADVLLRDRSGQQLMNTRLPWGTPLPRDAAEGDDQVVATKGAGGVWQVEADAAQLETAILNLAINGRDAMPNGGKLTVEASNVLLDEDYCSKNAEVRPGQYVQIAVTDNGSGMTADILTHAFEPFFTTKQIGQGTGLGLSQVYGFVSNPAAMSKFTASRAKARP